MNCNTQFLSSFVSQDPPLTHEWLKQAEIQDLTLLIQAGTRIETICDLFFQAFENTNNLDPIQIAKRIFAATPIETRSSECYERFLTIFTKLIKNSYYENIEDLLKNRAIQFSNHTNVELSIRYYRMLAEIYPGKGRTPLHFACENKDSATVIHLLETYPLLYTEFQSLDKEGYSPLFLAIKNGCFTIVDYAINNRLPLNLDTYPNTYDLISAVIHEKHDTVSCYIRLFNHMIKLQNLAPADIYHCRLQLPTCLLGLVDPEFFGCHLITYALDHNHISMATLLRTAYPPDVYNPEDKKHLKKLIEKIDLQTIDPKGNFFDPWIPSGYNVLQIACIWDIEPLVLFSFSPPLAVEKQNRYTCALTNCMLKLDVQESPFDLCIKFNTRIGYKILEAIKKFAGLFGEILAVLKPSTIKFLLHTGKNPYDYLNHQKAYALDNDPTSNDPDIYPGYFHKKYIKRLGHDQDQIDYALYYSIDYFLTGNDEYLETRFIELLLEAKGNPQKCLDLCLGPNVSETELQILIPILTNSQNAFPLNINAVGSCGTTLLHWAILNLKQPESRENIPVDLIDILVSKGARIDIPNNEGETVIDLILKKGFYAGKGRTNLFTFLCGQNGRQTYPLRSKLLSYPLIGNSGYLLNFIKNHDKTTHASLIGEQFELTDYFFNLIHTATIPLTIHLPDGVTLLNAVIDKYCKLPLDTSSDIKEKHLNSFRTLLNLGARPKVCNLSHFKPGNTLLQALLTACLLDDDSFLKILKEYGHAPTWEDILPIMKLKQIIMIKSLLSKQYIQIDDSPSCQHIKTWVEKEHTTNPALVPLAIDLGVCCNYYKAVLPHMTFDEKKNVILDLYKDHLSGGIYPFFIIGESFTGGLQIRDMTDDSPQIIPINLNEYPLFKIKYHLQKHIEKRFDCLKKKFQLSDQGPLSKKRHPVTPEYKSSQGVKSLKVTPHPFLPEKTFVFDPQSPDKWGSKYINFLEQLSSEIEVIKKFIEKEININKVSFNFIDSMKIKYQFPSEELFNEIIYFARDKKCLFVYGQVPKSLCFTLTSSIKESYDILLKIDKTPLFYIEVFDGPLHEVMDKHAEFLKKAEHNKIYHEAFSSSISLINALKKTENYHSFIFFFENLLEMERSEKMQVQYKRVDLTSQTLTLEIYLPQCKDCINPPIKIHGISFWRIREKLIFFRNWLNISLQLDEGAYRITADPFKEIEFKDPLLEINFKTLLTEFNSLNHLKHTIPKNKISEFINNISGNKIIIALEKPLLSKTHVMVRTIIKHIPNLEDNDKLTIFKELARISNGCIPEINKGLYDIILRWVKGTSAMHQLNGMDYFIAKTLDFAKRSAFYSLADYGNNELPADTHIFTYITNQLTIEPKIFQLPLDLMTHQNHSDPYKTEAKKNLGDTASIKNRFSNLFGLYLGHAFVHTFEQFINSQDDFDKKNLENFYTHLIEIIECHFQYPIPSNLEQFEDEIKTKSHELDILDKKIQQEIHLHKTAHSEYLELQHTLESLIKLTPQDDAKVGKKRKYDFKNYSESVSRRKIQENEEIENISIINNFEAIENRLFSLRLELSDLLSLQQEKNHLIAAIDKLQLDCENYKKELTRKLLDDSKLIINDFELEEVAIKYLEKNPSFNSNFRPLPGAFPALSLSIDLLIPILSSLKIAQVKATEATCMRNADNIDD